jgi:hypothetical protein
MPLQPARACAARRTLLAWLLPLPGVAQPAGLMDRVIGGSAVSGNLLDDPRAGRPAETDAARRSALARLRQFVPYRAGRRRYLLARVPAVADPVVEAAVREAAALAGPAEGVDPAALLAIARAESGFRNIATRLRRLDGQPVSTAFGPFQILRGTWADTIARRAELGLTPADREDPAKQTRGAAALARFWCDGLAAGLGRPATVLELYGAWAFGLGPGLRIARAAPATAMTALVAEEALAANLAWGLSVAGWRARMAGRLGEGAHAPARLAAPDTGARLAPPDTGARLAVPAPAS